MLPWSDMPALETVNSNVRAAGSILRTLMRTHNHVETHYKTRVNRA